MSITVSIAYITHLVNKHFFFYGSVVVLKIWNKHSYSHIEGGTRRLDGVYMMRVFASIYNRVVQLCIYKIDFHMMICLFRFHHSQTKHRFLFLNCDDNIGNLLLPFLTMVSIKVLFSFYFEAWKQLLLSTDSGPIIIDSSSYMITAVHKMCFVLLFFFLRYLWWRANITLLCSCEHFIHFLTIYF